MFGAFLRLVLGRFLLLALHLESSSFPQPLSPAQEQAAFEALAAGDKTARDTILRHNLRLVAHIAKKYRSDRDDQDDLISIGTIGLMKAVSSFDPAQGSRFSTYASRCIENEIKMYFRKCRRAGVAVSLQEPIEGSREDSELTIADLLADDFVLGDHCEHQEEVQQLRWAVAKLEPRQREIIRLRYGLENSAPMTQQEVADLLDISRSYVSRLEKRALLRLRRDWPGEM